MSEKTFVAAAKLEEVPAGTKKLVELNGTEVIVCNSRDKLFAVRNLCSHAYEALADGKTPDMLIQTIMAHVAAPDKPLEAHVRVANG